MSTTNASVLVQGETNAPPGDSGVASWLGAATVSAGSNSIPIVAWEGANSSRTNLTVYMPPSNPQIFTYDLNGNMTGDGQRAYTWDEENRLMVLEGLAPSSPHLRSENLYDAQSRRIQKKDMSGWNGTAYATTNTTRFIWDGWNIIAEYGSGVTNRYVWGLDLSQSLQGAGGIGGLLCVIRNGTPYFPVFDGNGNISDYLDQTGAVVAHYEYDPFGRTVVATGAMKDAFSFRFSTKYYEPFWNLYYYGRRFYSAEISRWLNRDPVGENGGLNTYSFVRNAPGSYVDPQGRAPASSSYGFALGVERVGQVVEGPCGDFDYVVQWLLKSIGGQFAAQGNIAQQMHMEVEVRSCRTKQVITARSVDIWYWEAFSVENGTMDMVNATDYWEGANENLATGEDTYGHADYTGVAFYKNAPLSYPPWVLPGMGPIPPGPFSPQGPWGALSHIYSPSGLVPPGLGSGDSDTVARTLYGFWNCCCRVQDTSVVVVESFRRSYWL